MKPMDNQNDDVEILSSSSSGSQLSDSGDEFTVSSPQDEEEDYDLNCDSDDDSDSNSKHVAAPSTVRSAPRRIDRKSQNVDALVRYQLIACECVFVCDLQICVVVVFIFNWKFRFVY